jgi:hypothetical protein
MRRRGLHLSHLHEEGSQSSLVADETKTFRHKDTPAVRGLCFLIGLGLALSFWALSSFSKPKQIMSLHEDKDEGLSVPPSHDWTKMESWLCPGRVPNLTAAVTTFRMAQQVFLKRNESLFNFSDMPTYPYDPAIKEYYFSFWPGHMLLRRRETNKTIAFLRTYKCGSETIEEYFNNQLSFLGHTEGRVLWDKFLELGGRDSECICSSYRDPMDHFFSGLGELEMRRAKDFAKGKIPEERVASYERLHILSVDRLVGFVDFLLQGEWFKYMRSGMEPPFHSMEFAHVFPQSGYLVGLHSINRTITAYIPLANLSNSLPTVLEENCGLPNGLPPVNKVKIHDKVPGLSNVYKKFWANGSATALSGTSRLPIIHALCLFHAMDYACLAPLLKVPPPEVCAEAFVKYLLV